MRTDVEAQVVKIIKDHFGAKAERTSSFKDDLGADSLDAIELALELEDAFDVEIPDADAEGFVDKTVDAVVTYIEKQLKNKEKPSDNAS